MRRTVWAAAALCWLAQAWPIAAAEVVGVGNVALVVADLERSVAFYRDVLELEPDVAPTPYTDDPVLMRLGGTPAARSRIATFRIPGSELGVELIEYRDIDRRPNQARFQDPGAVNLQLRVRSLGPILARLPRSEARIWTPSGEPVSVRETLRILFLQDPDGFFVELIENASPPAGAPGGNVIGADFELMIADSEETARFYRDALGFDAQVGAAFDDTKLLTDTVNTLGAAFRRTASMIPGTNVSMPFLEFSNITRKPVRTRTQDPGTAILQLRVSDVAVMTARLAAAGGSVVTEGGEPVALADGRRIAMVRDPNNLLLELLPEAAPRVTRHTQPAAETGRRAAAPPLPAESSGPRTATAPPEPAARESELRAATATARRFEPQERQTFQVTVVEVRRIPSGAVFTLDDDTVWVQSDARRATLPEVPFAAEIRPGAMGSYFLVAESRGAAVRVRRRE